MVEDSLVVQYDRRSDVCGPFCDATPQVTFEDKRGVEIRWCRDCYERDCSRCSCPIEADQNKRKGLCQDCRDEIAQWSAADSRDKSYETTQDSAQTTLADLGGAKDG